MYPYHYWQLSIRLSNVHAGDSQTQAVFADIDDFAGEWENVAYCLRAPCSWLCGVNYRSSRGKQQNWRREAIFPWGVLSIEYVVKMLDVSIVSDVSGYVDSNWTCNELEQNGHAIGHALRKNKLANGFKKYGKQGNK
jgi:hypothetical protein